MNYHTDDHNWTLCKEWVLHSITTVSHFMLSCYISSIIQNRIHKTYTLLRNNIVILAIFDINIELVTRIRYTLPDIKDKYQSFCKCHKNIPEIWYYQKQLELSFQTLLIILGNGCKISKGSFFWYLSLFWIIHKEELTLDFGCHSKSYICWQQLQKWHLSFSINIK